MRHVGRGARVTRDAPRLASLRSPCPTNFAAECIRTSPGRHKRRKRKSKYNGIAQSKTTTLAQGPISSRTSDICITFESQQRAACGGREHLRHGVARTRRNERRTRNIVLSTPVRVKVGIRRWPRSTREGKKRIVRHPYSPPPNPPQSSLIAHRNSLQVRTTPSAHNERMNECTRILTSARSKERERQRLLMWKTAAFSST